MFDSLSGRSRRAFFLLVAFVAAAGLAGCSSDDDMLTPDGPAVVRVFVTSSFADGDLGGLAGADALCTNVADDAGLSGGWTAWMSDSGTDARSRIPDGEYRLLNGVLVADDLADLTDGTLDSGISVDENGDPVMAGFAVWTGTDADGLRAANHCNDWTGGVGQVAQFGFTGSIDAEWTNRVSNATCAPGVGSRIYCFAASAI